MRWIILCLPLVFIGCTIQGYLTGSLGDSYDTLQQTENFRVMEHGLPSFLIILDSLVAGDPEDEDLLLKAAQFHTSYALSFVESKDPEWAKQHYHTAKEYMDRKIELDYEIKTTDIVGRPEKELEQKLQSFEKEQAPDLFWWGMSWGLWVNSNRDKPEVISQFPYVKVVMNRVLELDPGYQNGLPHLFFGVYYGSVSQALGGEPAQGKNHFDQVLAITQGEYLTAKVLCAKTYCCSIQDRKLYQKLLEEVISAPLPQNRNFTLGNAMAKQQARELLLKIDDYFLPEMPSSSNGSANSTTEPQSGNSTTPGQENSSSEDDIW